MIIMQEDNTPPARSYWCGDYDFTENEVTKMLKEFHNCRLINDDVVLTCFKDETERWSVYVDHPGAPPLFTAFVVGWECYEANKESESD